MSNMEALSDFFSEGLIPNAEWVMMAVIIIVSAFALYKAKVMNRDF